MARYAVDIDAPADQVYALIADARRRIEWLPELDTTSAPDGTLQAGDRFDGVASLLGHRFLGTSDVTSAGAPTHLEERVVIGAAFRTRWTIVETGDRTCRVEHDVSVEFPGGTFGRIERWILTRRLNSLQRTALERMRALAIAG